MLRRMSNRDRHNLAMQAREEFWARKAANPTYEQWLARYGAAERAANVREFIKEHVTCRTN